VHRIVVSHRGRHLLSFLTFIGFCLWRTNIIAFSGLVCALGDRLFWSHLSLGWLFCEEGRFDDAHAHVEHAKSHTIDNTYNPTLAMELQAMIWYRERRLEEARSEALRATDVYEKLGAAEAIEACRKLAQRI